MNKNLSFVNLIFFVIFCLAIASTLFTAFHNNTKKPTEHNNQDGLVINKSHIVNNNLVALEGEMEFYPNKLLSPKDFEENANISGKDFLEFPNTWNGKFINGKKLSGIGHATYRTQLYFDTICDMAIKIKDYCNSYKLWINGELISQGGVPGKNKSQTIPVKVNSADTFTPKKGANEFVLQVSNYHEKYGGLRQAFIIGSESKINELANKRQIIDAFVLGIILIMSLYQISLYTLNRHKKSFLYFGLLAFFIFIRQALLSDIFLFDPFIQNNVFLYLKITIASAVLSSLMLGLFFRSVFPELLSKKTKNIFVFLTGASVFYIFLAPIYYVSVGIHIIQAFIMLFLIYIFYLLIKSFWLKINGRSMIAFGFLLFLMAIGIEFLIFNRIIYSDYTLQYGLVVFILFQSYALSADFLLTHKQNIKLAKKLEYNNKNLQRLAEDKSQEAIEAKERELFSVILQKSETDNALQKIHNGLIKLKVSDANNKEIIDNLIKTSKSIFSQNETEKHLVYFEKIHPDFISTLQARHPSLSQNELKLAAYIKLNMTHKEIARILSVQAESVRKAKTRMRQKMGLSSDKEISYYLNSLENNKKQKKKPNDN